MIVIMLLICCLVVHGNGLSLSKKLLSLKLLLFAEIVLLLMI
jgi:hypothetical protein